MKKIAFVVVALGSLLALAAIKEMDVNVSTKIQAITSGLLIAPRSLHHSNAKIEADRITRALGASATIDFAAAAVGCEDSSAITVYGARVGDTCSVGVPISVATADAGAEGNFTCRVSASDAVKVRFCTTSYENPASETFRVRVISSQ